MVVRVDGSVTSVERPVDRVEHPFRPGVGAYVDDIDGLIELYQDMDRIEKTAREAKTRCRLALAALTEGDAKTRRVAGKRRVAKVGMPDDSWNQSILKEIWNSYPDYAIEYLAIDRLRVKMREYKKLLNTSGEKSFNLFRDILTSANQGPTGLPTITVEK